jgi:hypothetical protein
MRETKGADKTTGVNPRHDKFDDELNMPSVNWFLLLAFAVHGPALSMTDLMKIFRGVKSDTLRRHKSELSKILQD